MPARLVLFSCGVIAASFLPQLPPLALGWMLIPLWLCVTYCGASDLYTWHPYVLHSFIARLFGSRSFRLLVQQTFFFLLGFLWGIYSGHELIGNQLPAHQAGQEFVITGYVDDLPKTNSHATRFVLKVDRIANLQGEALGRANFPSKLQLSWYRAFSGLSTAMVKTGDYWQVRVRLKPPRGFVNPAGFDYQAWLLRRGIGATGYVVDDARNKPLPAPTFVPSFARWIDIQRYQLQQWLLAKSDSSERGILIALLIGDSSLVDKTQWLRMQQTGTNHLIAISGLHVGFLAIFGFYLGLWLGKTLQLCWHKCPALIIAYFTAISCALFYSALAGFNIPTLRTAIMLSLFYWLAIYRRSTRGIDIYCVALALVMVLDPLAAFDMGFWLSFGAVGLLLFYFSGRYVSKSYPAQFNAQLNAQPWQGFSPTDMLVGFMRSQWVMFIGLLVPLSILINSVSLLAPVANAIAIPLITFFVVPCLLLAASLQALLPDASGLLLLGAETGMEWLKIFLHFLLHLADGKLNPVIAFSPGVVALLLVSCAILLLPKGLIARSLGYLGVLVGVGLTFLLPVPQQPDLRLTVLDVGQGTAIVLQTPTQTLVYDTGPEYSEEFDAGSAIVAPYLRSQGITHIDTLIVSHMDQDHAGGLEGLLSNISVDEILLGESPRKNIADYSLLAESKNCHQVAPWQWGDVSFRFLTWPLSTRASANNHSCVLLIRYAEQTILLPGDIEKEVEQQLLRSDQLPQQLTLLLAPHHGSHSSSNLSFVNYTAPETVIYSAGYNNRYGHPHADVRKRYQHIGSQEWNTAMAGALIFEWHGDQLQPVIAYREKQQRYWFASD